MRQHPPMQPYPSADFSFLAKFLTVCTSFCDDCVHFSAERELDIWQQHPCGPYVLRVAYVRGLPWAEESLGQERSRLPLK